MSDRPLLPGVSSFFAVTLGVSIISAGVLMAMDKPEAIPTVFFGLVTALLSYWACSATNQKLRLDLFDKRFEIYKNTLSFCSVVMAYASLHPNDNNRQQIDDAILAAHESFRGIGYHKTKALFGPDIIALFSELNNSFAYLATYSTVRAQGGELDAAEYSGHVKRTVEIAQALPDHFKPYMYFGDVRLI